jgi:hypothetical protein
MRATVILYSVTAGLPSCGKYRSDEQPKNRTTSEFSDFKRKEKADAQTVINQLLLKEIRHIESAYFFGPRASSNFVRTPAHALATLLLGSVAPGMVANPAFFT